MSQDAAESARWSEVDQVEMRRALALAEEGWGQTAPNPMVGAVVVSADGKVVGEGFHARFGAAHAERVALEVSGERARAGTVYVTLEPCIHQGKTPPCVDAILAAGIARVVVATRDANPEARGGIERLRSAGVTVDIGLAEEEARELNAAFFHRFGSDRPWVTLKLATSIDGCIRGADERQLWLSGPEARREVHRMRAGHDAIAIGRTTAFTDDPRLTVREGPSPRIPPTRVIFDSRLRTPLTAGLISSARKIPTVIIARDASAQSAAALEEAGVTIIMAHSVTDALRSLRSAGIQSLLVEGGARLAGSFLSEGVVDRLVIFQTPVVLGRGALNGFAFAPAGAEGTLQRLRVVDRRAVGDDLMMVFAIGERTGERATGVHRTD